ncbi:NAD(P)H-binding protein [Spirosoma taeanense]|uniref:NAD(P)H-binding protein n=1 Tax=Spirosoma taeanense TaxID=2735870 RepID=A0A6M5Y577_9BACT|nr:NAD(P)H-binding protein [Spirosoma taeanense]QJW89628.1 NAD(P)H-binding protein [Spirosoma taeanense]
MTHFNSTIAILGGAGKTGRPLVQEALNAGYRIRLLLRQPETFEQTHERLEIIQGDARNPESIQQVLHECTALFSTLGNPKEENVPILSTVTRHILTAMQERGIRRYVTVTSLYDTSTEQQDRKTRQAAEYMQQHFPLYMADRQLEFQLLSASNLDWTYVRLPYVVEGAATGRVKVDLDYLPGEQITSADLAHFLVSQLDSRQYVRQAPFVANG